MVDKAASVCALRHAGRPVVTVAMERAAAEARRKARLKS